MKTLPEQIACAKRELEKRREHYPIRVAEGKMSEDAAQHQTECMEGIVATLEKVQMLAEVSEEMKKHERVQ